MLGTVKCQVTDADEDDRCIEQDQEPRHPQQPGRQRMLCRAEEQGGEDRQQGKQESGCRAGLRGRAFRVYRWQIEPARPKHDSYDKCYQPGSSQPSRSADPYEDRSSVSDARPVGRVDVHMRQAARD